MYIYIYIHIYIYKNTNYTPYFISMFKCVCMHIYIYIYIHTLLYRLLTYTKFAKSQGIYTLLNRKRNPLLYGQFLQNMYVCFCGLDPGNLKFETVRRHKQHICF